MTDLNNFNNIDLNLEILAEEAAEVIQIKSKIIRFGIDDYHPKNKEINRNSLETEIGHFIAMVDILKSNGLIKEENINKGKVEKFNKLHKYYTYR